MKDCNQLAAYVDGELGADEADAFALHLASCTECRAALHEAMQLVALEATAREQSPHATRESPRATARRRWWRRGPVLAIAAALAAAIVLVVVWPRRGAPPAALVTANVRTIEGRVSYAAADRYRRYEINRGGSAAPDAVSLDALADLEHHGDLHGVAAGYLLMNDLARATTYLDRAAATPDVASDRALLALTAGHPAEALIGLDAVLETSPHHPQAMWNRALALRDLGLTAMAADAFTAVASVGEPGWAAEARTRADVLTRQLADFQHAFEHVWRELGPRLATTPDAIDPALARRFPGLTRLLFYDAVRTAASADAVRALAPLATTLDTIYGGDVLARHVSQIAHADFAKRAPLAARYAAVLGGTHLDSTAARVLLDALRAAHQDDLLIGAIVLTSGGHVPEELVPELGRLADATADPWFSLLATEQAASALVARGEHGAAEVMLLPALARCTIDYRCASLDLVLGDSYLTTLRLTDAARVLSDGWTRAVRGGEWFLQYRFLTPFVQLAGLEDDVVGSKLALVRAYTGEMLHRDPRCEVEVWGRERVASVLVNRLDVEAARAELARMTALERTCPAAKPTVPSMFLAAHILRDPTIGSSDVAALRAAIATLRATSSAADRALLDQSEGRLLIDRDRATATTLLERAIAAAHDADNVDLQKARSYAYSILTLDAGRAGEWARVWQLLGDDAGLVPANTCALGVAVEDRRSLVVVRDATGVSHGVFDPARSGPAIDAASLVPPSLREALRGCAEIDVVARPPVHGLPGLLPQDLAWSYRWGAATAHGPTTANTRVVISAVQPPAALGLPPLLPWRSASRPDVAVEGASATPARVLAELATAGYVEIHAHGTFAAAPSDASFLVLSPDADGQYALTASAIRKQPLRNHPIVILAACNAALVATYRHEVWSLPSAFIAAGARAVFASSDVISDGDAGAFFDELHVRLERGGSPATALRDARVAWLAVHPNAGWVRSLMVFQ